jgi:hypothetical protein
MKRRHVAAVLVSIVLIAGPAVAGEVNGSASNPKHYYAQGKSICDFSGLNDDPTSTDPTNPGGRTQSYGQDVRNGYLSPTDPNEPSPGTMCDPNSPPSDPGS